MKLLITIFIKTFLILFICYLPGPVTAQQNNFKLVCPLNEAKVVPSSKKIMHYDKTDLSIVLTSIQDTIIKACFNARVTNTEIDEAGKSGVVLFAKINNNDYYFWYSGLVRTTVKRLERVKAGQPIGFINPGDKIEFMIFDFETPVDPIKYLDCKELLRDDN